MNQLFYSLIKNYKTPAPISSTTLSYFSKTYTRVYLALNTYKPCLCLSRRKQYYYAPDKESLW